MTPIAYQALQLLYAATLVLSCLYAVGRGGREHRIVAATHFAASVGSGFAVMAVGAAGWREWQPTILLIDLAALAVFMRVALSSTAFWPLWVTGFHFDSVLTHLVRGLSPAALPAGYSILQGAWAYPLMAALTVGTWRFSHERDGEATA